MGMKIYINGKILDESEAKISVMDRGYLFGEGLFETIRAYDGSIPFLDKHLNRMEWSATFIGIPFPYPSEIKKGIFDTLKENKLKDARVKVILSAKNKSGFSPLVPTGEMDVHLVIGCESFKPFSDKDYEEGVNLAFIHSVKNDPPPVSDIKSVNWLTKMIGRREFSEKDCFDGILLDAQGFVTETTTSNIFWVEGEKVFTPPTSIGLLPGVTRDVVIQLIKDQGYEFEERIIKGEKLTKASEVFITGSTLEVMPVTEIDSNPINSGEPGKLTKEIQKLYKERVEEEIKSGV